MNDLGQLILSELRDIRTVHSVGAFPLGLGWWILFAVIIFIIAVNIYIAYQKSIYRKSWKFSLEKEIDDLSKSLKKNSSFKEVINYINEILKRIAIHYYGRNETASLQGENWLKWLSARDPEGFNWIKNGKMLVNFPYMPENKISVHKRDIIQILKAIKPWLK